MNSFNFNPLADGDAPAYGISLSFENIDKNGNYIAICLTLYNEPARLLQPSLESVVESLDALGADEFDYRFATICIIADGERHLSDCARSYLATLELVPVAPLEGLRGALSERTFRPLEPVASLGRRDLSGMTITIQLIAKAETAGKLDSHWWFYQGLCCRLDPDYCFQIDAGTMLDPAAFRESCALFEADPGTAAIAGNILVEPPRDGSLLQGFQCADFAVQKTIRWPSEVLSGFLSVIPGQFSGARWRALTGDSTDGGDTPKDRYLRGRTCRTAAERMMYLSEDRVFGFELVTQPGARNQLEFAHRAICHTDPCATVGELLQQRRRWLNGNLACRSWMIAKTVGILADRRQALSRKLRFATALVNLSVQHILEWFLPLLSILLLAVTWRSLSNLLLQPERCPPGLVAILFLAIALVWVLPMILALSGRLQTWPDRRVETLLRLVAADFCLVVLVNVAALSDQPGMAAYLYYFSMPFTLAVAASLGAAVLHRALTGYLRATIAPYIALAPSLWLMLSVYAFFNLHDGSWGTKGLSRRVERGDRAALAGQFRKLRFRLVLAWGASNVLIATAIIHFDQMPASLLAAGTVQLAMIVSGLAGAIAIRAKQIDKVTARLGVAAR